LAGAEQGDSLADFLHRCATLERRDVTLAAAFEAFAALDAARIPTLFLKGLALEAALYEPGEHRGFLDFDVLVAPDRLANAATVLGKLGYRNAHVTHAWETWMHAEYWWRPVDGARADLHWSIVGMGADPADAWSVLWAGSEEQCHGERTLRVLGRDATALHVALHAAQHGPRSLKAIGDLNRALARWPDAWTGATDLAARLDALPAYIAGLRLTPQGRELVERLGLDPHEGYAWIRRYGIGPRGSVYVAQWEAATGTRAKLAVARAALLPSRRQMLIWYPEMRDARWPRRFYLARVVRAVPASWRSLRYRAQQRPG